QGSTPGTSRVSIKVWLQSASATIVAALRKLGLEITATKPGNILLGRISLDKLDAVAKTPGVQFVSHDLGKP
ncbi:MAG: hypothetical protein JNN08_04490, partial [Bryobacterales bacterium]|nr:hypothetical protein [Bryobacterales bacterium]